MLTPLVFGPLEAWLAERFGAPSVRISDVVRHVEGFSWQTYTLTATIADGPGGRTRTEGLAVRVEPRDGLLAPYDIGGQYDLSLIHI